LDETGRLEITNANVTNGSYRRWLRILMHPVTESVLELQKSLTRWHDVFRLFPIWNITK